MTVTSPVIPGRLPVPPVAPMFTVSGSPLELLVTFTGSLSATTLTVDPPPGPPLVVTFSVPPVPVPLTSIAATPPPSLMFVVMPLSVLVTLMRLVLDVPAFSVRKPAPEYVRPPNVPVRVTVVPVTV